MEGVEEKVEVKADVLEAVVVEVEVEVVEGEVVVVWWL